MTDDNDDLDRYERNFQMREKPQSLLARGSTPVVVQYQDGDGNWRSRIKMSRVKFDDKAKEIFLDEYRKWGRMMESASRAGVSPQTVRKHIDEDEDFAQAVLACEEEYKDRLIGHHQDLVFNGTQRKHYDRNGVLIFEETQYPIRLIELELKKHDPGYREKQEVAVNHSGGVLIAPATANSVDDWEKRFSKAKDITPQTPQIEDAEIEEDAE